MPITVFVQGDTETPSIQQADYTGVVAGGIVAVVVLIITGTAVLLLVLKHHANCTKQNLRFASTHQFLAKYIT